MAPFAVLGRKTAPPGTRARNFAPVATFPMKTAPKALLATSTAPRATCACKQSSMGPGIEPLAPLQEQRGESAINDGIDE